ncbi:MAG TPA: OstA-like protein [Puia sp.]|jgi:lipopolysaccharide export system protein LptA
MKIRIWVYAACLFGSFLLLSRQARAQGKVEFRTPGSDSIKVVDILNTDSYRFEHKVDSAPELTYLVGHVRIKQEKTFIDCDSLVMNPKENYIESFGHVHINDNDSTNIYSDYMKYRVDTRKVHFEKNVRLTDGKGVLTTEDLDYDLNAKVGTYEHGGKIVNKESVLTSERATYYEATKDVHFNDKVVLRDPQYDLSADSLLYNTQTQVSTFITETYILFKDSTHRSVRTKTGYYDLKNKKAYFGKRPDIVDGSKRITGEDVQIDDSTGISTAIGNAVYTDTAEGVRMIANYMITNKKTGTFLATQRPVMILKQDKEKDSIYITADTLLSLRLSDAKAEQKKLALDDSLHRAYVDSLMQRSADSLHNAALKGRQPQDTLQPVDADSTMTDHSDSLRAGVADSLDRPELDSLHKRSGVNDGKTTDSTVYTADSLSRQKAALKAADTTKGPPLTPRQQRRKEKEDAAAQVKAEKAKVEKEKARKQAIVDSVKEAVQDRKDSVRKAARIERARQKALTDSLNAAAVTARHKARAAGYYARQQAIQDSINARAHADSLVIQQAITDSLKKKATLDSLEFIRTAPARDSARRIKAKADSIANAEELRTDSSLRVIKAFHHVRIFSDSLQAVSDSLYYSAKDSIFRLFYSPIAWSNGNYQIAGDTMFVYTKNKKASRLYVFENALSINKVGANFFNQLKGTTINTYFKEGEVDFIRAKGNAESVYYTQDDNKAYTGVNKAHADIIDMIFAPKAPDSAGNVKGRELNRVVLRSDAEGSFIPIKKVSFDDMRLRGFKWMEDKRPKTKQELFSEPKKVEKYEPSSF